jgi:DNA gyrase subunit B
LHHLLDELVRNSLDEFRAGFGTRIEVDLLPDGGCRVTDDAREIPVMLTPDEDPAALEILFTTKSCRTKCGLHWVPALMAVNALSARLEVEVERDGKRWQTAFQRGEMTEELRAVRNTSRTGTTLTFRPDPFIFKGNPHFDFDTLAERLRELAFLNPGLTFTLTDQRETPTRSEAYHFPDGVIDFVRFLNRAGQPVHSEVISCRAEEEGQECTVAFQWTTRPEERVRGYANSYFTRLGGTHVTGFRHAVTRPLLEYARSAGIADERECPTGEDCHRGLTAVVALQVAEPQFIAATGERLNNLETEGFVRATVGRQFAAYLERHPDDARAIWGRVLAARDARLAQGAARRRRTKK